MKDHRHTRVLPAGTVTGAEVRNPAGEYLGTIIDLMVDWKIGQVAYAVLSSGGFNGTGRKFFALPWIALTVEHDTGTKHRRFVLDIDKEWLRYMPGFNKDHWPRSADLRLVHALNRHNGQRLYDAHRHDQYDETQHVVINKTL